MPTVQALRARHIEYKVADEDHDTVGEALYLTLAKWLGADFTPETRETWVAVYALLAEEMERSLAAE